MTNKYTGEVSIKLDGRDYVLVYDWTAISAMHSKFSDDLEGGLMNIAKIHCPFKLAEIMAIGLALKHPEMTAEKIVKLSPPFVMLKKPIDAAIAVAYFGADLMKKIDSATKIIRDGAKEKPAPAKKKKK